MKDDKNGVLPQKVENGFIAFSFFFFRLVADLNRNLNVRLYHTAVGLIHCQLGEKKNGRNGNVMN